MDETSEKQLNSEIQLRPTLLQEDYIQDKNIIVSDTLMANTTDYPKNLVQPASSLSNSCGSLGRRNDWNSEEKEEEEDSEDDNDCYCTYTTDRFELMIFFAISITYMTAVISISELYFYQCFPTKEDMKNFQLSNLFLCAVWIMAYKAIQYFYNQIILDNRNKKKTTTESIQTVKFDKIYSNNSTSLDTLEFNHWNPPPPAYDGLAQYPYTKSIKSPWSFQKILMFLSNKRNKGNVQSIIFSTFLPITAILIVLQQSNCIPYYEEYEITIVIALAVTVLFLLEFVLILLKTFNICIQKIKTKLILSDANLNANSTKISTDDTLNPIQQSLPL